MKFYLKRSPVRWLALRLLGLLAIRVSLVANECLAAGEPLMGYVQLILELSEIVQTGRALWGLKGMI